MRFSVCIKQVPDVSAPIQVRDGRLVMDAGRVVLNAYDASAVEAALVLVEAGGGEVEVVLVGPERAGETMFCYTADGEPVLRTLEGQRDVRYLHRRANLEDVFLKLTGRDLRD